MTRPVLVRPIRIVVCVAAAMLPGDHVFDVKGRRSGIVRKVTVFTALARSLANELAQRPLHPDAARLFRKARALACKMLMKSMA